jgi:hypothetical protein
MNALNTSAWIKLDLTHNVLNNRCQEIKFDMHSTIENIKMVCYMKFGTPVE